MSKLSGFIYPEQGLKIFLEDFQNEQSAVSAEIIDRWKQVFGTGVIWGGAVTVSGTAGKVDVAEMFAFDNEGKIVYFPTQTAQVTLAEGTNYIVARHKFVEFEENQPYSNGQISKRRENSFELIARTSAPITGDVPLRIVTMASGVRTLSTDLRTYAALQEKINRIDELGTAPAGAFADIAARLTYLENMRPVGETFDLFGYVAPSAAFPAFPLSWSNRTVDAANWPDLVAFWRAHKMRYMAGEAGEKSAFDITHYARSSNVVTITLANTAPELALLSMMAEANLVHGSFAAWWAINIPIALGSGDVPAGDYAPTGIDAGNRQITFTHAGSNVGTTGVSRTLEVYPHRIPGSTTTCRHYQGAGRAKVAVNDADAEVWAGAQSRDRFQGHWHKLYSEGTNNPAGGGFMSIRNNDTTTNTDYGTSKSVRDAVTDGVNDTPRTGKTTNPRALGVVPYIWARRYAA